MIDLAVSVQEFQKFLFLALCSIIIVDHHGIIVLDLVILEKRNIHDRIVKSESYKHQSHASCNSENSHKESLLITEKISHGRFPGKAQMLPDKADPLNKDPFSFFRCRRTHQGCRCLCQSPCTGKKCGTHSTDHCCSGSDQCILHFIIQLHVIADIPVHDPIRLDNDKRKNLFSEKYSCDTSTYCSQKCIAEILGCNGCFSIAQCFHCSDLCPLLLHHSCHCGKTDQSRYKEEYHRENLSDVFQPLCVITKIRIFRKVIAICDDPLRCFNIIHLFLGILDLLPGFRNFIIGLFFAVLIFFLSIGKLLFCVLQLFFGVF